MESAVLSHADVILLGGADLLISMGAVSLGGVEVLDSYQASYQHIVVPRQTTMC